MDFDKPLGIESGYLFYNLLMDYIDTFVFEYVSKSDGEEYPSLRVSTDMILTLFNNFSKLDIDTIDLSKEDALTTLADRVATLTEIHSKSEAFDSRKLGLFVESEDDPEIKPTRVHRIHIDGSHLNAKEEKREEALAMKFNTKDITLLKSMGIKVDKG